MKGNPLLSVNHSICHVPFTVLAVQEYTQSLRDPAGPGERLPCLFCLVANLIAKSGEKCRRK